MVSSCSCGPILLNGVLIGLAAPSPPVACRDIAALASSALFALGVPFWQVISMYRTRHGFQVLRKKLPS